MLSIAEYRAVWNSQAILTPAERMRMRVFKEFGAYCRTVARNSMVDTQVNPAKRKAAERKITRTGFIMSGGIKVSKPGAAAFSKLGYIKRNIFFASDKDECVIGPALLTGLKSQGAVKALERGGTEQLSVTKFLHGRQVRISLTANYKARPTMGLAFIATIDKKLPKLIQNGIMREA